MNVQTKKWWKLHYTESNSFLYWKTSQSLNCWHAFWITTKEALISEFPELLWPVGPSSRHTYWHAWEKCSEDHHSGLKHYFRKISVEYKHITWERETRRPFVSTRILPRLAPKRGCWVAKGNGLKEKLLPHLSSEEPETCEQHSLLCHVTWRL